MNSKDYQNGLDQDLRQQVLKLKQMAPGLEQYGRAKEYIKHLKYEIEEIVQVLKDTDEDY